MLIGDGRYDNTLSLQSLFDRGGKITIPEGVYLTGPLTISKSADIRFEEGSVIRFIPDFSLYKPVYTRWEGVKCWCMHPCLYIKEASCVTLSGKGVIDGSGDVWWNQANARRNAADGPQSEIEKKFAALNPDFESQPGGGGGRQVQFLRPPLVQIHSSQDVALDGLRLQNSPFWTLHPLFSKNITLKNLVIENPAEAPNTDGIDIAQKRLRCLRNKGCGSCRVCDYHELHGEGGSWRCRHRKRDCCRHKPCHRQRLYVRWYGQRNKNQEQEGQRWLSA